MHGTIESAFRVEWRPLAELAAIEAPWRSLAARALEPNVFYEPDFALAAEPVFGRDVGAGLVWSRSTAPRLLGLFPARIERKRYGVALPVLVAWTHPYGPFGVPLVDRETAEPVIGAWLDHVSGDRALPNRLLMPFFTEEGPVARAFASALARRGGKRVDFSRHRRALLAAADGEHIGYLDRALGAKKRKELRRQRRRLGDRGVVIVSLTAEPATLSSALSDFVALEAGGWKGRAHTAARNEPAIQYFLETAVMRLANVGQAQIARLFVDSRAIAAIIILRSGDCAWCWKIAYDETMARSSPGVQLLLTVTEAMLEDLTLARTDSCATADHPMIDHVWRERLAVADRFMRVSADDAPVFAVACVLESLRRRAISCAKRLRDLVRA